MNKLIQSLRSATATMVPLALRMNIWRAGLTCAVFLCSFGSNAAPVVLLKDDFTFTGHPSQVAAQNLHLNYNLEDRQKGKLAPIPYIVPSSSYSSGIQAINTEQGHMLSVSGPPYDSEGDSDTAFFRTVEFSPVNSMDGLRVSFDFFFFPLPDSDPPSGYEGPWWTSVTLESTGGDLEFQFQNDGKLKVWNGDQSTDQIWKQSGTPSGHIEILFSDSLDGNPFDGVGSTTFEVFVNGAEEAVATGETRLSSVEPFFSFSFASLRGTQTLLDNLKIEKHAAAPASQVTIRVPNNGLSWWQADETFTDALGYYSGKERSTLTTLDYVDWSGASEAESLIPLDFIKALIPDDLEAQLQSELDAEVQQRLAPYLHLDQEAHSDSMVVYYRNTKAGQDGEQKKQRNIDDIKYLIWGGSEWDGFSDVSYDLGRLEHGFSGPLVFEPQGNAFSFAANEDLTVEAWLKLSGSQDNYAGIFQNSWSRLIEFIPPAADAINKSFSEVPKDIQKYVNVSVTIDPIPVLPLDVGYKLVVKDNKLAAEIDGGFEIQGLFDLDPGAILSLADQIINNTGHVGPEEGLIGTKDLNDGKWHHVALTVNRTSRTAKLYVDGKEETSVTHAALGKPLRPPSLSPGDVPGIGNLLPSSIADFEVTPFSTTTIGVAKRTPVRKELKDIKIENYVHFHFKVDLPSCGPLSFFCDKIEDLVNAGLSYARDELKKTINKLVQDVARVNPGMLPNFVIQKSPPVVFKGGIDELAIYRRALSHTEIQSIFHSGSSGKSYFAPVTQIRDRTVIADAITGVSGASIDDFSFDPDRGETIPILTQNPPGPYSVGSTTVTLTATDSLGDSASETATVTVVDITPPVVLKKNITVQLDDFGHVSITPDDVDNGSHDNSTAGDPSLVITLELDVTSFTCEDVGENVVTLAVTDTSGNVSTATVTVLVEDSVLPIIVPRWTEISLDATGSASISPLYIATYSDNCNILSGSESFDPNTDVDVINFTCADIGEHRIPVWVTDVNGNQHGLTIDFAVLDTHGPSITLVGPDTIELTLGDTYVELGATVSDVCDQVVDLVISGIVPPFTAGEFIVYYNATDDSGNIAKPQKRSVTVKDPAADKNVLLADNFNVVGNSPDPFSLNYELQERQVDSQEPEKRGQLAPVSYTGYGNAQVGGPAFSDFLDFRPSGRAALNYNFNEENAEGGWQMSADFSPNFTTGGGIPDPNLWVGVVIGANEADRTIFVNESPSHFGILFRMNGRLQAWDGNVLLTPNEPDWLAGGMELGELHRFHIVASDPEDGNPFDGLGDTKIDVFIDDGTTAVFSFLKEGGYFNNSVNLQAEGNAIVDNLEIASNAVGKPAAVRGMVAWWKAENNGDDSIGSSDGTLLNGADYTGGKVGQGFDFDGVDDYFSAPSELYIGGEITVDVWVNISSSQPGAVIAGQGAKDTDSGASNGWLLHFDGESGLVFAVNDGGAWRIARMENGFPFGGWHHIMGIADRDSTQIILDGQWQGSGPGISSFVTSPTTETVIQLGKDFRFSDGPFFRGMIDELTVYRRALIPRERFAVRRSGSVGKISPIPLPPDAVSWWRGDIDFNDAIGDNHGHPQLGAFITEGQIAGGFGLDGTDDYVLVDAPFRSFGSEITVEYWARIDAFEPGAGLGQAQQGVDDLASNVWRMSYGKQSLEKYDLELNSYEENDLPTQRKSLVVVAMVVGAMSQNLHVIIFNPSGVEVVNKGEADLIPGSDLDELKALFYSPPPRYFELVSVSEAEGYGSGYIGRGSSPRSQS